MIRELSLTLQAILEQRGLPEPLAEARIVFDRPTQQVEPDVTTLNLFLYDIRDNRDLRSNEISLDRRDGLGIIQRPATRIDCTYLITAWIARGTDVALQEHQLLSQVLQLFCRYPTIPEQFLQDTLKNQAFPVPLSVSCIESVRNPTEFWSSLGIPLRAALAITATIAVMPLPDSNSAIAGDNLVQETVLALEQLPTE